MASRAHALVADGRLQVGPWYVLADELIPSGESLIRNLLAGRADAERWGRRLDVLYSPDAFGHPAVWPALAAEFGIRFGVLWRGLGGEPGQEGDLFRWRAPDGREVLLHHLSPDGYEAGSALPADAATLVPAWKALKARIDPRARSPHVAVFVGADHHAAHPAIGALRDLLAGLEPEAEVRVSRLDEYFDAASTAAEDAPLVEGELRWSYGYTWTLQGVHATRAPAQAPARRGGAESGADRRAPRGAGAWPIADLSCVRCSIMRGAPCCDPSSTTRSAAVPPTRSPSGWPPAWATRARWPRELARASLNALGGNDPDVARDHPGATAPRLVCSTPRPGGAAASWSRS